MIYKYSFKPMIEDINSKFKITNKALLKYLENTSAYEIGNVKKNFNHNLIWVLTEWDLKVINRPNLDSTLDVHSWAKESNTKSIYKDFEIYVNDNLSAIATSKWMLLDKENMTSINMPDNLKNKYAYDIKEVIETSKLEKMLPLDNYSEFKDILLRKIDIDMYGHVHNLAYLDFLNEIDNKEYNNLRIIYIKQIKYEDKVIIYKEEKDNKTYFLIKANNEVCSIIECF